MKGETKHGMVRHEGEETNVIVTSSYGAGSRFQYSIFMNGIKYKVQYDSVYFSDRKEYAQVYLFRNNEYALTCSFKLIS